MVGGRADQTQQITARRVLVCPPNSVGWDAVGASDAKSPTLQAINDERPLPFVVYATHATQQLRPDARDSMTQGRDRVRAVVSWKIAGAASATGENSLCPSASKH